MESVQEDLSRGDKQQAQKSKFGYGSTATDISPVVTEDLASFLIAHLVVIGKIRSLSELKAEVDRAQGLDVAVDQVLARMEDKGLVELKGDEIICHCDHIDLGGNPAELDRFLPNLFRLAARRVIKNERDNPVDREQNRESIRFYVLPDDPQTAKELRELELEFKAKVLALFNQSIEQRKSERLRFVGSFNCILDPEDFA